MNSCDGRTVRVWAPLAESVRLVLSEKICDMQQDPVTGYWAVQLEELPADGRYAFSVDGSDPFPDPRGHSLPEGVHGFSKFVNHSDFSWSDGSFRARPLGSAVIYELHVGTFSPEGTFDAAIEHLPQLRELGVTHLNVMPVASASGTRGWGYDGVGLYAPWEAYGGPSGFKRFVAACHEQDLAVLLDVVYNHLGPEGNYLGQFGPYFTDRYHTPWGDALNLDGPYSDEVRRFILDNLSHWVRRYHVDGFRLDAVHALHDSSAVHILEEMSVTVRELELELGKPIVLIAESDLNDTRLVTAREAGGYGLTAQWSDDFHHAVHCLLTGERNGYYAGFGGWEQLSKALTSVFVRDGHYAPHRKRSYGRPANETPRERFVHCVQNHDQVGNRAVGERLSHLVSEGRAMIAAALNLLSPAVPMLFQGEEWACSAPFQYFTDHQDTALARAVSDGRKREFSDFGWSPEQIPDPQDTETFTRSVLRRDERLQDYHARMLQWYTDLIRLRMQHPELSAARYTHPNVTCNEHDQWMAIRRGSFLIVFTLSEVPVTVAMDDPGALWTHGDAVFGFPQRTDSRPSSLLLSNGRTDLDHNGIRLESETIAVLGP